jgi:hypothetical protein
VITDIPSIYNYLIYRAREGTHKNADDVLFDMFKNEDTGLLPVGKFLAVSNFPNPRTNNENFYISDEH